MAALDKPVFDKLELNQDEMKQIKAFVLNRNSTKVYCSYICGRQVIWRGMSRTEYKNFLKRLDAMGDDTTGLDLEDTICHEIIMHPSFGQGPTAIDLRTVEAGFSSQLFQHFMNKMGFSGTPIEPIEI